MMRVDQKQLSDSEPVVGDRQTQRLDAARAISRRQQALLAAAGESGPVVPRWYVLTVDPGQDIPVDNVLTNAGIEHWMASLTIKPKRRGKRKWQRFCPLVAPALPGYLFVRAAWGEMTWAGLSGVDGVTGVVGGALSPLPLRDKEVTKFRARVEHDPDFLRELLNALKEGDAVRVDDGPFASFPGVVLALRETGRAKVEVDIFGRRVPVDLELAQISKVE